MDYTITKTADSPSKLDWITWHPVEQRVDQGAYNLTYRTDHYTADIVITQVLDDYVIYRVKLSDQYSGLNQIIIKTESIIFYEDPSTSPQRLIWESFTETAFYGTAAVMA